MHNFYLICPIGLEELVIYEIKLKQLDRYIQEIVPDKGGVSIHCPLETGLALNSLLRTPTRILLRLLQRKCRDFPRLYQILSKYDWRCVLDQESLDWSISTHKSRIINTSKALNTCTEALSKYFKGSPLKQSTLEQSQGLEKQKAYIRINEDQMELSIDTSGQQALYIRGDHSQRGKAPLRENYGASLLLKLKLFLEENHLQASKFQLIDPMCSTGMFLRESNQFFTLHKRENFPFKRWKLFSAATQEKYSALLAKQSEHFQLEHFQEEKLFSKTIGLDISPATKSSEKLKIFQQDLFSELSDEVKQEVDQDNIVIMNPPYGKRIGIKGDRSTYYQNILKVIKQHYRPQVLGMLIPANVPHSANESLAFNNNGIKVRFCLHKLK